MENVACPLCGADEASLYRRTRDHLFRQPGEFTFVRCSRCGLVYLNPRPTLDALTQYYPENYFCYRPAIQGTEPKHAMGGLVASLALSRIRQLEKYTGRVLSSAHILDVGCGGNSFLYHLNRLRGCETLGVDFNAKVVNAIQQHYGMKAMCGYLPECRLPTATFDGVGMYEYLEHEGRPRDILAEARRITKPGGWLALEIPNIGSGLARLFGRKWCQLDAPRHLVLYDPVTIRRMLEQSGYEIIAIRPLCYQWMFGFSVLVAMGFRNMGMLPLLETTLAVAITLPFLPLTWLWPEFLRIYARAV